MRKMLTIVWLIACFGCYTADLSADGGLSACTDECPLGTCSNGFCLPDNTANPGAGVPADVGVDAGMVTDSGSQLDTGTQQDSGPQPDSGVRADAGAFVEGWQQLDPPEANGPGVWAEGAMAYFPPTQRTVLFGGYKDASGQACENTTFLWDGADWTRATTTNAPSARIDHQLVYDEARRQLVLFGGMCGQNSYTDTWVYDGSDWELKRPTRSPPRRSQFAMGYDPTSRRVVLFGGAQCGDGR